MWDYIVVGEGKKLTGAKLITSIPDNEVLSENSEAFWVSDIILGVYMTIYKTSPEGIVIDHTIKSGRPMKEIRRYLDEVALQYMTVDQLMERIEEVEKEAFRKGEEHRASEIAKLLNLRR
jgi:hypothetical protein